MKKGKVIGKKQLILAVMVIALGAAVWFNMNYAGNTTKYLGEAQFVDNSSGDAVETSANINNYFETARAERENTAKDMREEVTEAIQQAGGNEEALKSASDLLAKLLERKAKETNIENLLKAKNFADVIAIIGDSDVNIIVRAENLSAAETIQIQEVAAVHSGLTLDKIKILTVK